MNDFIIDEKDELLNGIFKTCLKGDAYMLNIVGYDVSHNKLPLRLHPSNIRLYHNYADIYEIKCNELYNA
jgi:hypothetical protein